MRKLEEKIYYEDRLIAFIDILGFSNMVEQSDGDLSKFQMILDFVTDLQQSVKDRYEFQQYHEEHMKIIKRNSIFKDKEYENPSEFDYALFSDSAVLTMKFQESQSLVSLVSDIGLLQAKYMARGMLLRGGITYGKVYHKDSVCFGPGFIKAYELERDHAKHPRIIIDNGILEGKNIPEWDDFTKRNFNSLIKPWLEQSVNPLMLKSEENDFYYVNPFLTQNSHDYYKDIKVSVIKRLEEFKQLNEEGTSKFKKWDWLLKDIERNPKVKSGQINIPFLKSND
jgi:hypothetical protein